MVSLGTSAFRPADPSSSAAAASEQTKGEVRVAFMVASSSRAVVFVVYEGCDEWRVPRVHPGDRMTWV
jgi:hypothetical protein